MSTPFPNLTSGSVPLSRIREDGRRSLVEALDSVRGKKVLVLDRKVSGFLGLIAEVPLLKEHGVDRLLYLSEEPLQGIEVRSVVYLVRSRIENAQLIAQQILLTNKLGTKLEYSVFFMPRRTMVCEKVFQEEGVFADVTLAEYPLDFIPFDSDILSLELDTAYKELVLDGDTSSLYYTARGLMRLQGLYGTIGQVKGKGPHALAVKNLLTLMRKEMGTKAPRTGGGQIETLVLVDRTVDPLTPLCTQLTYEGLVDETLHIKNGVVQLGAEGQKQQKFALNSADKVYQELRDLSFAAVGPKLSERAKSLQTDYKGSKGPERSLAELKDFAAQLKSLPNITRHINLAEAINRVISRQNFRDRVTVEQSLLDGHSIDGCCETIETLMYQNEDLMTVLRLLCILSHTQASVPRKHWDVLRREVLHTYGHEHVLTLAALQDAGLLKLQQGGRPTFPAVKKAFRLLLDNVNDTDPTDIAYTYAGYAPLSIRLVEHALRRGSSEGSSKDSAVEEALKVIPGATFDVLQTVDEHGLPVEQAASAARGPGARDKNRRVVLVMFIGGVTFAEVGALRFLSTRPEVRSDFIIATTKLTNGTSMLETFLEDVVTEAILSKQPGSVQT
ncbi:hypothetical protein ABBQ32_000472 [Trebouxia sp. C0010 RCD-2024]